MAKVKIKPFFYLILRRDENGKLHFDVYDFTEEGGILLKKISNDNGLLKYEDKHKEIKEYIETLVDDIADVYSRMGRIIISFRGSTRDESVVKEAVNLYNKKHENDENVPLFIFKEIAGNFSIEDYIEKINYYISGVVEKTRNSEELVEFAKEIHITPSAEEEFEEMMHKRKCSSENLLKIVDWYKKENSPSTKMTLLRNMIPTLDIRNDKEEKMFYQYVRNTAEGIRTPHKSEEVYVVMAFPEFSIDDSVEHNKLLEYIEAKEKELEDAVTLAKTIRDKYTYLLNNKKNDLHEYLTTLDSELDKSFKNDINYSIEIVFKEISKLYDELGKTEKSNFDYCQGDLVTPDKINIYCSLLASKYTNKYNQQVKPELIEQICSLDKKVYDVLSDKLNFNLAESKGFDENEYMSKHPFINTKTRDSFIKILTLKFNDKELHNAAKKKPIWGKNDFGVEVSKNLYKIPSLTTFSDNVREFVYSSCSKGVARNKLMSLILERSREYIKEEIPIIIEKIDIKKDDIKVIEKNKEINYVTKSLEEAEKLYMIISFALDEIKEMKLKFTSGGDEK